MEMPEEYYLTRPWPKSKKDKYTKVAYAFLSSPTPIKLIGSYMNMVKTGEVYQSETPIMDKVNDEGFSS